MFYEKQLLVNNINKYNKYIYYEYINNIKYYNVNYNS